MLCGLSYRGDVRVALGAEDARKIERIARGSAEALEQLYRPATNALADSPVALRPAEASGREGAWWGQDKGEGGARRSRGASRRALSASRLVRSEGRGHSTRRRRSREKAGRGCRGDSVRGEDGAMVEREADVRVGTSRVRIRRRGTSRQRCGNRWCRGCRDDARAPGPGLPARRGGEGGGGSVAAFAGEGEVRG